MPDSNRAYVVGIAFLAAGYSLALGFVVALAILFVFGIGFVIEFVNLKEFAFTRFGYQLIELPRTILIHFSSPSLRGEIKAWDRAYLLGPMLWGCIVGIFSYAHYFKKLSPPKKPYETKKFPWY